jgi:hypothetical protein
MYFVLVRPLGVVTIDLSLCRSTLAWALAVVVDFLATVVVLVCAPLGLFSACDGASGCNVTRDGAASTERQARSGAHHVVSERVITSRQRSAVGST